ncbi:hypothetical protein [Dentiradicibacter hellwigii]|uniref:Uncharacterized protein n=1 Tax=Dentiradicibacter hellwigii TaxID=3149053 RepID=A0ABV4UCJ4_9RHOO
MPGQFFRFYVKRLEASRVRGFGLIDLTNTVIAVTDDLLRLG